jgi:hydroxyacylglutathione hydrolase
MIFRRLYHERLAQASYLIACEATRRAIVIDPLRDPAPYFEAASVEDVRIELVTETHLHADFLSGAERLANETGAELLLSAECADDAGAARISRGGARPLRHGDTISVGRVRLDVRHSPGHTPEHLMFVVTDEATSELPVGLLTGDFLFVGDVGRPDLLERAVGVAGSMKRSAADLYRSLQTLRALPEYLQVWPGHGSGSACGKSLGAVPQSTLGYELRTNWAVQARNEAEFVREVLADQPDAPAYFTLMKKLNVRGVAPMPQAPRLDDATLRSRVRDGALVLDTRTSAEFLAAQLDRSINIPLGRSFLTWAGSVLDPSEDIILLLAPDDLYDAVAVGRDLALIGYDRVLGALPAANLTSFAPRAVASIPALAAANLETRASGSTILDVRSEGEWREGHIPGAMHVPLTQLVARIGELRDSRSIVVYCQSGARSATAASVLRAAGIGDVMSADGGFDAWIRARAMATSTEQGR